MLKIAIETQILLVAIATILLISIICYQVVRLGNYMKGGWGRIEVVAWILFLLVRLYGLFFGFTEQIAQAKAAGIIKESFTFNQWVNIIGMPLFLILIIYSKSHERRSYKKHWGV